jgi:hypothetical protein
MALLGTLFLTFISLLQRVVLRWHVSQRPPQPNWS